MSNDAEAALIDRDAAHLIHPLHSRSAHAEGKVWVGGEGAYLIDANGDRFIDGLSGLWNNTAGNGRVELVEAATRQMQELAYASGYTGSSNPRAIELAERLSQLTYPNINHFYFTSGGGEATDSNIKMARYYWKLKGRPEKTKVISRIWGYHGVTIAAMCCTGMSPYWKMFEPRMPGFVHIPTPYPYRYQAPEGSKSQGIAAANELEKALLAEDPDTVAMFLAEPVQGAGGVLVPQDDYFPRIREICDRYDVLLVSDEVITAFGRTGTMFGLQHWGVQPDLIQYAKAITSGYFPLGGIGVSDAIAEVMLESGEPWMHAYTYSAHDGLRRGPRHARYRRERGLSGPGGRQRGSSAGRTEECAGRSPARGRHSWSGSHVWRGVREGPCHQGTLRCDGRHRCQNPLCDRGTGHVQPRAR
jgi:adenosylmethionine-8-amino-7-oxononanoate aminotransferase